MSRTPVQREARAQPRPVRNPSRQLAYVGLHPSSALPFAFDEPLTWVISEMPCSPIIGLANQAGRRIGGLAPIAAARYGSHSANLGWLVVDDVADTRCALGNRGHRCRRGVVDVTERPDPAATAHDGSRRLATIFNMSPPLGEFTKVSRAGCGMNAPKAHLT
jgi:hypothetical protein